MLSMASIFLRREFILFGIQTNLAIIWKHKMWTTATDDPVVRQSLSVCLSVCHAGGCSDTLARWRHTMWPFLNYFTLVNSIFAPYSLCCLKSWNFDYLPILHRERNFIQLSGIYYAGSNVRVYKEYIICAKYLQIIFVFSYSLSHKVHLLKFLLQLVIG